MKTPSTTQLCDISINALHASSLRAMSEFIRMPTPELAHTVVRLLDALAQHPDRCTAPCGHNVYAHAIAVWEPLAARLAGHAQRKPEAVVH